MPEASLWQATPNGDRVILAVPRSEKFNVGLRRNHDAAAATLGIPTFARRGTGRAISVYVSL